MAIFYSNVTNCFFDNTIVSDDSIPDAVIAIDDDTYAMLMNGQASGLVISTDDTGNPVVTNTTAWTPGRVITSFSFVQRLTPLERAYVTIAAYEAISNATSPDPTLTIFLDDLGAATIVDLDNHTVQNAVGFLVELGILTSDRYAEILADATFDESTDGPISLS